jgi:hypothetical protein
MPQRRPSRECHHRKCAEKGQWAQKKKLDFTVLLEYICVQVKLANQ